MPRSMKGSKRRRLTRKIAEQVKRSKWIKQKKIKEIIRDNPFSHYTPFSHYIVEAPSGRW